MIRFSLLLLFAWQAAAVDAQVQLDRFFPPVVSTGSESIIQAEGKFPTWPVSVICDRDEIKVVATEKSGTFKVSSDSGTTTGIAWIRVHDPQSASQLVPLLFQPEPTLTESEPNNELESGTAVKMPSVVAGRLEKSGEVDTFRVSVRPGKTLIASVTANQLIRSPMDAVLQLVDSRGNVLQQSDDQRGLDPQIVYQCDRPGELYLRIFAFPETPNSTIGFAGSGSFVYVIHLTQDGFLDHALPMFADQPSRSAPFGWQLPDAPHRITPATDASPPLVTIDQSLGWHVLAEADSANATLFDDANKTPIAQTLPVVFSGHISQPGEVDRLRFRILKGQKYRASVTSRRFGFLLDSVLRIVDPADGSELARNDDRGRNLFDASLTYTAKADREVELEVFDLLDGHGPRHAYSVVLKQPTAKVSLSVAADHFKIVAGQSLEIPVTIDRADGYAEKIRLNIDGLPPGCKAEPVVSEPKGDSAKSVNLKLSADPGTAFQGAVRILGQAEDAEGNSTGLPVEATYSLRDEIQLRTFWITVAAK